MWYNHLLNTQTAWMGALDAFSGHGDCPSHGEKWIANIWIDIVGDGKRQLKSWKSGTNWIKSGYKDNEVYTILGNPSLKPKSDYYLFKARYSPSKNIGPDKNIKIADARLHFSNIGQSSVPESSGEVTEEKENKLLGNSKIMQSILLLLDELNKDELSMINEMLKKRMSPEK